MTPDTTPIPSSPEIRVRTMASDIAAIGARDGELTVSEGRIAVPQGEVYSFAKEGARPLAQLMSPRLVIILAAFAIVLLLGYLIYAFLYPLLQGSGEPEGEAPPVSLGEPPLSELPPLIPNLPPPATVISHASLFRIAPDETIEFVFRAGPATSAVDLETPPQRLAARASSLEENFAEVLMEDEGGQLAAADFFSRIDAAFLPTDFLTEHFSQDFTAFLYKDAKGAWPGYVLSLKKSATPVLVAPKTGPQIESASQSAIVNLFLSPVSLPRTAAFQDTAIDEKPLRTLAFGKGVEFLYGWFNNTTLVVSTSRGGMEKAFFYLGR